jgi:catechol 2,3-dioxygenase-like lactoylglutathione lyase family enzyme
VDPRIDIITVAVPDLPEAHAFYVDRLGCKPIFVVPGEITFLPAGSRRLLGLFSRHDLERDIGDGGTVPSFTLGQLFNTTEEVDAATEAMGAAGATVRKPPQPAVFFAGYHAYVETPDGTVWEFVHNPGSQLDIGPTDNEGSDR